MMAEEFKGEYYMEYIREEMKYSLKSDTFCGQIPSLHYQIIQRILISLWRDKLGHAVPRKLNLKNISIKMNNFEAEILKQILHLMIPLNCKEDLKRMNGLVKEQIRSFLVDQKHFSYFTTLDKFNIYFDSICWTPQGTINRVKTAVKIIEKTSLSTKDKYVLACNNCLKEKTQELHKILPKDFISDYNDDKFFLVIFWTFYARGKYEELVKFTCRRVTWIYLLEQSILFLNEVAVQFVIENVANREVVHETLMNMSIMTMDENPNICLYLWQEMPKFQRCMTSVEMNKRLLLKLHRVSEWCHVPPLSKFVRELIKHFNIWDTFEIIIFCWHERIIDLKQYITFWNELTLNFKLDFEKHFLVIFDRIFRSCLDCERPDFVTVKFLINKSTPENIKKMLYWNTKFICLFVICFEGPNFLETLICRVLKLKRKISTFKNDFFHVHGLQTIAGLIVSSKSEWIDEFISKFCATTKRNKFKRDLLYVAYSRIIYSIKYNTEICKSDFLTALNNYLNWQFKGNKKKICRYVSNVFDLETDYFHDEREIFFKAIQDFIEKEKWEFVERYWKWIYSATTENICSTKAKLTRMIKILLLSSSGQFISSSMKYFSPHKLFKRLATSCFKPDELEDLKELGVRNHLQFLVIDLLENDRHQEVHDLIDWFFSSDEAKVDEFKTAFMLSRLGRTFLFNSLKKDSNFNKITYLVKRWLNYSIYSPTLFHDRFVNFVNIKAELERQNLVQNTKTGGEILENCILDKNVQKCRDLLKELFPERHNLEEGSKENLYPIANLNSKKRVSDDVPFQRKRLRICLKKM